ncbi:hypothetical protein DFJ73DRAFT_565923 [Zopfochytrium polystomum]|nr:hypothetical protein DFJ73DRAFT_565923 [Zopfochytrium polystomum]
MSNQWLSACTHLVATLCPFVILPLPSHSLFSKCKPNTCLPNTLLLHSLLQNNFLLDGIRNGALGHPPHLPLLSFYFLFSLFFLVSFWPAWFLSKPPVIPLLKIIL